MPCQIAGQCGISGARVPEETAICVVDADGRIVKEMRVPTEPEALGEAFRAKELPFERIGLEACSLAAWLHDGLREVGLPVLCIETRQANAALRAMANKTDRNDTRMLAQIMRPGCRHTQARRDPAPDVARWHRVPLRPGA